jgi:hypothetical protein
LLSIIWSLLCAGSLNCRLSIPKKFGPFPCFVRVARSRSSRNETGDGQATERGFGLCQIFSSKERRMNFVSGSLGSSMRSHTRSDLGFRRDAAWARVCGFGRSTRCHATLRLCVQRQWDLNLHREPLRLVSGSAMATSSRHRASGLRRWTRAERFVYALGPAALGLHAISAYTVNASTGDLTPIAGSP